MAQAHDSAGSGVKADRSNKNKGRQAGEAHFEALEQHT